MGDNHNDHFKVKNSQQQQFDLTLKTIKLNLNQVFDIKVPGPLSPSVFPSLILALCNTSCKHS